MPRLDVSFKRGLVPKVRGKIPALREYWKLFCLRLKEFYIHSGHNARIIEAPLWQITEDLVRQKSENAQKIFIPHKMKLNWRLDDRVFYYMQMVVPSIFSIDTEGWCASTSFWPIQFNKRASPRVFKILEERISRNISKFPQPSAKESLNLPDKYIFFPCQIPYDETISFHSDI